MVGGQIGNDPRHEGHIVSRNYGESSGRDCYEGPVYGPQVELGVVPAHVLVDGPPLQYSEGDRDGTTGRIGNSCGIAYINTGHSRMAGDGPLIRG